MIAALICVGCAGSPEQVDEDAREVQVEPEATEEAAAGPFDAAREWAATRPTEQAASGVSEIVSSWKTARVARVYALGEAYRAVVVQKSSAQERPAVLLTLERAEDGAWQVTAIEATTSTHLWPEL